jgi:hypothetical protein
MDPVTTGALVASALGMAGEVLLKGGLSEAAGDSYKALKGKIAAWAAGADVEALERTPESAARRAVVAEAIDAQAMDEQTAARELARRLVAALKGAGVNRVGFDVGRLDALAVELGDVTVIRGRDIHIRGSVSGGNIKVSALPGDPTVNPPKPPPRR